LVALLF